MSQVTVLVAFLAGFFSFLNPCVLPLVPGFLGYLSGVSLIGGRGGRSKVFLHSLFFVLGFSCVFALAGVLLNTVLLNVSYAVRGWLGRIGGTLIILFGLHLLGLLKLKFLETGSKITLKRGLSLPPYFFSFVFGAVFGVSWTPCVGAILGSVLALAVSQPGASFALLVSYALGIGLPFLFVGAFSSAAVRTIRQATGFLKYFNAVIGIFLLALGILVFTGNLSLLVTQNFFNKALLK